jgi:hypothetical protein
MKAEVMVEPTDTGTSKASRRERRIFVDMATPAERNTVAVAAKKAGQDLSPFVRETLLAAIEGRDRGRDRSAWLAAERLRRAALVADEMLTRVAGAVPADLLRQARDELVAAMAELE